MKGQWRRLALRVGEAVAAVQAVPSPCSSICRVGADATCEGCLRTLDEIQEWSTASDAHKRQVWERIGQRLQVRLAAQGAAAAGP